MGQKEEIRRGIMLSAKALGINPIVLATVISYETKGTFNPIIKGPTTQHGTHEGLIQFGEPQAKQNGVNWKNAVQTQLGPNGAVVKYMRAAGVRPGMGLKDVYSAVNAGRVGRYNASDANNGGAPGTVADKVAGMDGHKRNALRFMGGAGSSGKNFSAKDVVDDATASVADQGPFPKAPFQPVNAAIVPHNANTDRDVASRDTNNMNPNDLIQRMMAAGGRQSTNIEDRRPMAVAPDVDGQAPMDDPHMQEIIQLWTQQNGRPPQTEEEWADVQKAYEEDDMGTPADETGSDVLKKMGMDDAQIIPKSDGSVQTDDDGDGYDDETREDIRSGPRPMEPYDSEGERNYPAGSSAQDDPAFQSALVKWMQMNGGKSPATDSDFQQIEDMISSVKQRPTGPVGQPQRGYASDPGVSPQQMILQKMLGGANR